MKHLLALTAAVASALTGAGADGGNTQFSFTGEEEGNRVFLGSCPTVSGDGRQFAFEWNDQIWLAATGGAVIATDTFGILDYGTIRVPRFGVFCLDGADMEFNGARPDVEVDNRPDELAGGVDRQLETALGVLKEDVETWRQQHPPVQPVYAR